MIFENLRVMCDRNNEAGRDKLLIIITTSALTNVSFTLCCLFKNTDTWEGGRRDIFRMNMCYWAVWIFVMDDACSALVNKIQKYILMISLSISDVLLGKE